MLHFDKISYLFLKCFPLPQSLLCYKKINVWIIRNLHDFIWNAAYFLTLYKLPSELNQMSLLVNESVPLIGRI